MYVCTDVQLYRKLYILVDAYISLSKDSWCNIIWVHGILRK